MECRPLIPNVCPALQRTIETNGETLHPEERLSSWCLSSRSPRVAFHHVFYETHHIVLGGLLMLFKILQYKSLAVCRARNRNLAEKTLLLEFFIFMHCILKRCHQSLQLFIVFETVFLPNNPTLHYDQPRDSEATEAQVCKPTWINHRCVWLKRDRKWQSKRSHFLKSQAYAPCTVYIRTRLHIIKESSKFVQVCLLSLPSSFLSFKRASGIKAWRVLLYVLFIWLTSYSFTVTHTHP